MPAAHKQKKTSTSSPAFRCSETARHSLRAAEDDEDDDGGGGGGIERDGPRVEAEAATPAETSIGIKRSSDTVPTLSHSLTPHTNPRFRKEELKKKP